MSSLMGISYWATFTVPRILYPEGPAVSERRVLSDSFIGVLAH